MGEAGAVKRYKTLDVVMERLTKALEQQGAVQVLRQGFSIAGCGLIEMTETAPEDMRNEAVIERYKANILRVVPELKYHPAREFAIDLVFFINGMPVATVELKRTSLSQQKRLWSNTNKIDCHLTPKPSVKNLC